MQLCLHAEERKKDLLLLELGTADAGAGRAPKALIPKAVDADDEDEPESDSSSDDDDEVRGAVSGRRLHGMHRSCVAWDGLEVPACIETAHASCMRFT